MLKRTVLIVVSWFFLMRSWTAANGTVYTVVGPFKDQKQCDLAEKLVMDEDVSAHIPISCWEANDAPVS